MILSPFARLFALVFLATTLFAAPARAQSGADCGSVDESSPCTGSSVSNSIDGTLFTWSFECDGGDCQVGRFLDGDPWVRHPTGGDVIILDVTPDDAFSGLERNPATGSKALTREQGLLSCATNESPYNSGLDLSRSFPIIAPPDDSVYVKAKKYTGGDCNYTSQVGSCCVDTYATLTVVENIPADGGLGRNTFRPSMAGTEKVWLRTFDLDLSRLPSYPEIDLSVTYENIKRQWMSPYPDFYTGIDGDKARRWAPKGRGLNNYAASRAEQNIMAMFKTFGDDPLTEEKRQAVYALVRYGLDIYAAYLEGVEWNGGAGQHQGYWHPLVYLGALARDETIRDNVSAATANTGTFEDGGDLQFIELYQVRRNVDGIPIWGSAPGEDGCRQGSFGGRGRYWADYARRALAGERGKATCGDPYGYIDGPAERPGISYASCCSTGPYVSIALAMKIWPEFESVANYPPLVEFADRVMDGAGWWVAGDQCAAIDPRENGSCDPYTETSASSTCQYFGDTWGESSGSCVTIDQAATRGHPAPGPRWPVADFHLQGRPDDLFRGRPGQELWDELSDAPPPDPGSGGGQEDCDPFILQVDGGCSR